jgi:quercetin dioxygenase-like cupin family protein
MGLEDGYSVAQIPSREADGKHVTTDGPPIAGWQFARHVPGQDCGVSTDADLHCPTLPRLLGGIVRQSGAAGRNAPVPSGRNTNTTRDRRRRMIRCIRLWTGDDGNSYFEEGAIDLAPGQRGDLLSGKVAVGTVSFQETASGGTFAWHTAPVRQLVITLSGTLDFQTREGAHFLIRPGDLLLAEDTAGSGHSWRLTDGQPWRRAYVVLEPEVRVPFLANSPEPATP